jgi:hypothetical protein
MAVLAGSDCGCSFANPEITPFDAISGSTGVPPMIATAAASPT